MRPIPQIKIKIFYCSSPLTRCQIARHPSKTPANISSSQYLLLTMLGGMNSSLIYVPTYFIHAYF